MWRYFYSDVKKEGIILYEESSLRLAEEKILTDKERLEMMKEDFDLWFPSWEGFLEMYKSAVSLYKSWEPAKEVVTPPKKLPDAWAEHILLVILALLLGFWIIKFRKKA